MSWQHGEWSATHALPIGASQVAEVGQEVTAGDVLATGTVYGTPVRVAAARRLGVAPHDLGRVMRVGTGAEVEKGAIVARTGRRFARAVSSPIEGRLAHVRGDGDIEIAPIVDRWAVRSTLDGVVSASSEAAVTVSGSAWCLQGVAAYGPDAIGELSLMVEGPADEIVPTRIDVSQRGRILVGGGRSAAEAIARAHACGASAMVAGAVPAGGLRAIFGDAVTAHGGAGVSDTPTVLCLLGFGTAQLPPALLTSFRELGSARAAIHAASARLFVFAADVPMPPSFTLALAGEWGAIRPLEGPASIAAEMTFASERTARAVVMGDDRVPEPNVLSSSSPR